MMEATGTWSTVLYTVAAMDLTAAFLAIMVLRPTLAKHVAYSKKLFAEENARGVNNGALPAGA
jgi:OFA family oxalate/formate antiporter-like MFS transporter